MNVMSELSSVENEALTYLANAKVQSSDYLTDEDWEILGISPGVAYKSGWYEGFCEAFKLLGKKEVSNG